MPLLDRLIWQIETNLDSELSLPSLSERCAVNVHHMCRAFQLATGMSIMSYVRARRLSNAARVIVSSNANIITVALDAGYGSHEAFTRAFASYFGTAPSSLRNGRFALELELMEPFEMNKEMIVPVRPPQKRERAPFRVVGLGTDCSFAKTGAIPALWQSFFARESNIVGVVPGAAYGVCCMAMRQAISATSPASRRRLQRRGWSRSSCVGSIMPYLHTAGISPICQKPSTRSGTRQCQNPGLRPPKHLTLNYMTTGSMAELAVVRWRYGYRSSRPDRATANLCGGE
ncbi:helix-turn-helix domain-containing protein [Rhizobium viscosum]|uniref:helix-turn-helix domain-containing protein n=1 Tax=Rhizobium viscosum TaxID=1673 RepID=UPI0031DBA1A2